MASDPSLQTLRQSLTLYAQNFSAARTQAAKTLVVEACGGGSANGRESSIRGKVRGGQTQQDVVLSRSQGTWLGRCTCSAGIDCAHAYSLAMHWLETPAAPSPAPAAQPAPQPAKPQTFPDIWAPILAEKAGRPLTKDELHMLKGLGTAFQEFSARNGVYKSTLQKLGLSAKPDPYLYYTTYEYAFADYWPRNQPPADAWALWQCIAYDWECAGRALPAAFLPFTNTSAVRAAQNQATLSRELLSWRSALLSEATPASSFPSPSARDTEPELTKATDFRVQITPAGKADFHAFYKATKKHPEAWRVCTQKWLKALDSAGTADIAHLPPLARDLALALRLRPRGPYGSPVELKPALDPFILKGLLADPACHPALVLPDGSPFRIEPEALQLAAVTDPTDPDRLRISYTLPDHSPLPAHPPQLNDTSPALYLWDNRIWRGPTRPPHPRLPVAALKDPSIAARLRAANIRLPENLTPSFKIVTLRPLLRAWLDNDTYNQQPVFRARLFARAETPPVSQEWLGHQGWRWLQDAAPPPPRTDEPHFDFDLSAAHAVGAHFADFRLEWWDSSQAWNRQVSRSFPEDFIAWRAQLPPDLDLEVSPDLRGLLGAPLRARLSVTAAPAEASGQDWFDLTLQLQPEDLTLTPEEIQLLVKARGQWVRLPARGWQRLSIDDALTPDERAALDHLGLAADSEALSGRRTTHRYHALQLTEAPVDDAALAARLRARAAELRALPPPPLPAGLSADLRPYQREGYHFLAHLSANGLGGVLADDMGLGKTVQTLAWLLHLSAGRDDLRVVRSDAESSYERQRVASDFPAESTVAGSASDPTSPPSRQSASRNAGFRALIVAPKSVVPNWSLEAARFTPALTTARLLPGQPPSPDARLLVINYTQLRLRAAELAAIPWDAVILDEGQNIKNPASATAHAARDLPARHRVVLTGTPIENRLLDLWSLFAFAQPGLLGPQATFQRLYNDKEDPAGARARLAARVRPFMLRRTKSQVARDLPARIEEELSCELEGPQRALYEAELKRARQMLLDVKDARQFDAQRFNILQSLLRLRQICCDPRLVSPDPSPPTRRPRARSLSEAPVAGSASDPSESPSPPPPVNSAKLEALLDTIEPLAAEGHRVLVFSQFVKMLELIRTELDARGIGHLLLTGQTEDRQSLVNQFQSPDGPPVFLLSLKAAGSGLNLTAASYVVLFDPWWNPAVEAQAIDRTHRIGQKNTVMAYRLIAKDTVEEKIRALQREKAALAAAVVQEESLATVMDLESLRRILA